MHGLYWAEGVVIHVYSMLEGGDGEALRKRVASNLSALIRRPYAYRGGGADVRTPRNGGDINRRICGRCLGIGDFIPGSVELCRCAQSWHSFSDDH
jgi:hypothetical protein